MGCTSCGGSSKGNKGIYKSNLIGFSYEEVPKVNLKAAVPDNVDVLKAFAAGDDKDMALQALEKLVSLEAVQTIKELIKELDPQISFKGRGKYDLAKWNDTASEMINSKFD